MLSDKGFWIAACIAALVLGFVAAGCGAIGEWYYKDKTDEQVEASGKKAKKTQGAAVGVTTVAAKEGNKEGILIGAISFIGAFIIGYLSKKELQRRKEKKEATQPIPELKPYDTERKPTDVQNRRGESGGSRGKETL